MYPALLTIFQGWMSRRDRIAEAKAEAEIERAKHTQDNAGIKDEIVLLIWSYPAITSFIPGLQEHNAAGWEQLRSAPEWYVIGYVSICLAIYGIKPMTKEIQKWMRK